MEASRLHGRHVLHYQTVSAKLFILARMPRNKSRGMDSSATCGTIRIIGIHGAPVSCADYRMRPSVESGCLMDDRNCTGYNSVVGGRCAEETQPTRGEGKEGMLRRSITIALYVCALAAARQAHGGQITNGQVSDFQDGTTQGWVSGAPNPNPPTVLLNSHGPGDHALEVVATGVFGAGSRLATFNSSQWAGDYLSADVTSILMDLNNVGSTDLDIRLAVSGSGGDFSTTSSLFLTSESGWTRFAFPVDVADWTSVGGFNLNATLSAVGSRGWRPLP